MTITYIHEGLTKSYTLVGGCNVRWVAWSRDKRLLCRKSPGLVATVRADGVNQGLKQQIIQRGSHVVLPLLDIDS